MERLQLFWGIHLMLLALFVVELIFVASIWLQARVPGIPLTASRWHKVRAGIRFLVRVVFSRQLWLLIKAFMADGLLHRRVLRISPRRWAAHMAVFGSFLGLGFLSTVTGLAVEIFPNLLPNDHFLNTNIVSVTLRDVDHPVIACVNESLGLIILAGLVLIIYRRYIEKDPQLRTMPADTLFIGLLTTIVISGFPLEAFRLLAHQPFASTAGWGFGGYLLASLLHPLDQGWELWYNVAFWFHFATANLLLFYAPFSRFAHVVASPLIVALSALEEARA